MKGKNGRKKRLRLFGLLLLALVCVAGVELAVCRAMDPDMYRRITEPAAVFLRTAAPLSLDAPDGRPVQLFLCLLIPENDDGMYLKILREAAC